MPDAEFYGKVFTGYGALGILAMMLIFAVRTLWQTNKDLQAELRAVQAARIVERDGIVKALADQTRVMEDLASRRLR